jgi:hypothetical protein
MNAPTKDEGPRAATPGPSEPIHPQKQKGNSTIMAQQLTDIPAGGIPEYLPDRYDRLRNCAEVLASGTDFGDGFLTADMVIAFANDLTDARVLDGLTDYDSDTVGMLVLLDFVQGLRRMAWRLTDWLSDNRSVGGRDDGDELAVVSVLARVLAMSCAAFVGQEFEEAQGISGGDITPPMTTELEVKRFELPSLPMPKSGDDPIFVWDTVAEIRAGEIFSAVRRFAYWGERDDRPIEYAFEAFIEGLPETCGVADVVATHPGVLADLAAVSAKAAELLAEFR